MLSLTTPPEGCGASIGLRRFLLPSPLRCGLGLRGFTFSGPARVHWRYGPATRLHPKDGLSIGFRSVGFPPACHSGYGASDCYPGGTDSRWTHQPFLDAQRSGRFSRTPLSPRRPTRETSEAAGSLRPPAGLRRWRQRPRPHQPRLVDPSDPRVARRRLRRADPTHASPRARMYGYFTEGTDPPPRPYSTRWPSLPTAFVGRLPRPTPVAAVAVTQLSLRLRYYSAVRRLARRRSPLR